MKAAKKSMTEPQYYMYSYTAGAANFTTLANGDLNANGVTSSFSLLGVVQNNAVHTSPNIIEVNAEE